MNILLVEDNPADMMLLKDLLEEADCSATLNWVSDGHEALDYVYQRNGHTTSSAPDIILLDLGLPRIDGYDVLRELKKNPDFAKIPIVILTTSRNPLDRAQCATLGADSYLPKPYNLKGYDHLVQQLIHMDFPRLNSNQHTG